jgi:hypothetical protein
MATKSMAYDHPAYTAPSSIGGVIPAGVSSQFKFMAWTNLVLKSVQAQANGAGTGAAQDILRLHRISNSGTTTTSLAVIGTWTAGQFHTQNWVGTYTFTQGDALALTKGTDATVQLAVGAEIYLVPGANVTG